MKRLLCAALALAMVLALAACGGTSGTSSTPANTNGSASSEINYPTKSINVIVPYGPGGGQSILANAVKAGLPNVNMVISNMAGSAGGVGAMEVYHSNPDGYTVLCTGLASNAMGSVNGQYAVPTAWEEFVPVATVVSDRVMVVVSNSSSSKASEFKTWEELAAYAKEHPGELSVCGGSAGGYAHVMAIKTMNDLGIDMHYVPIDGSGDVRTAIMGGQVDVGILGVSEIYPAVASGDVTPVCVISPERSKFYPDVPTLAELEENISEDYDLTMFRSYFMPPNTPTEIADKLSEILKEACESQEVLETMEAQYCEVTYYDRESVAENAKRVTQMCQETWEQYFVS